MLPGRHQCIHKKLNSSLRYWTSFNNLNICVFPFSIYIYENTNQILSIIYCHFSGIYLGICIIVLGWDFFRYFAFLEVVSLVLLGISVQNRSLVASAFFGAGFFETILRTSVVEARNFYSNLLLRLLLRFLHTFFTKDKNP